MGKILGTTEEIVILGAEATLIIEGKITEVFEITILEAGALTIIIIIIIIILRMTRMVKTKMTNKVNQKGRLFVTIATPQGISHQLVRLENRT
jgi:hypothetical protein